MAPRHTKNHGWFRMLTKGEMEAIDQRQSHQQSEWKAIPREGQIVSFLGTELVVLPGVFPPKEDTMLLAKHLPTIGGMSVLDVGTGTGALALWAAQQGAAFVVAVDIAQAAVKNAKQNVERLGFGNRVDIRTGHVFSPITPSESFDIILANLPGRNKAAYDDTSAAQWDTEFRAHRALFVGAKTHLRSGGTIYMVKANYPDLIEMVSLAETYGYEIAIIGQSVPLEGDPRKYYALALSISY
jgi:release factor glutamine methyltransferase